MDPALYTILVLVLPGVFLALVRLLFVEYRLDRAKDEMEKQHLSSRFNEADSENLEIKITKQLVTFISGDHVVGSYDRDTVLEVMGQTYTIVSRNAGLLLTLHGNTLATSQCIDPEHITISLTINSKGYRLVSADFGFFPFILYDGLQGIGIIDKDSVQLPRTITLYGRIFSHIAALSMKSDVGTEINQ